MKYQLPPALTQHLDSLPHGATIRDRQWITTNDLLYIHKTHLKHIPLSTLLRGLSPYSGPKNTTPKYTPQFQAQLDKLRLQLEEEEYQQIVNRGKTKIDDDYMTPAQITKQINSYITNIVNVFVTVGATVWATWHWTGNNPIMFPLHYRVLLCLFFGLLLLVADVVVLNSFFRKIDEAKQVEKRKKVVTKIADMVVIRS